MLMYSSKYLTINSYTDFLYYHCVLLQFLDINYLLIHQPSAHIIIFFKTVLIVPDTEDKMK